MEQPESSSITAIEPQVKRPDRVSIFIDGEFALGVHVEVAAGAGLRVGMPITVPRLQELARGEEKRRVRESALKLLGYRARSRGELRLRLTRKAGYDPDLVDESVEALSRAGLLDDAEFSRAWVRDRTGARPMGPRRLAAELRQKGVDREVIAEALEQLDPAVELDLALGVARQKVEQFRGEEIRVVRRKLSAALMRRGFSPSVCARVLDTVLTDP